MLGHAVVVVSALCNDSGVSVQYQVSLYSVQRTCPDKSLRRSCFLLTLVLYLYHAVIYVHFFAYWICACYKPSLRKSHLKKKDYQ